MKTPETDQAEENDPVWNLLDRVVPPSAGPFFVRDVMREIRRSSEKGLPWWKQFLTPRPVLAGSLAAIAAAILITVSRDQSVPIATTEPTLPAVAQPQPPQLEALLEQEMLSQAAEDPSAFSDEALVALLNQ